MTRGPGVSVRTGIGLWLRRGSLLGVAALLLSAAAALAASSRPTGGGHYVGQTSQKLSINVRVAKNDSEFQSGKIFFSLHGKCHARRFFSVSPTPPPAVTINAHGHFSFTATFPAVPSFKYKSKVTFRGQFSQHGKVLTGFARYTASRPHASCTSGLVTFKATRH